MKKNYIPILLSLLLLGLLISCGNSDVAGGFGSETSSGVAIVFDTTTQLRTRTNSSEVAYEILSSHSAPQQNVAVKPIITDTIPLNFTDSVPLAQGSYTIVSHLLGSTLGSITQRVEVGDNGFTEIKADLAATGTAVILIPKRFATNFFVLYIKGTPFIVDLSTKVEHSTTQYKVILDSLPTGEYDSLVLFDTQGNKNYGKVSNSFIIPQGDTTTLEVDTLNWPLAKSDGVVTVNWRLRSTDREHLQGVADTVVTYLISAEYDSFKKRGFYDSTTTYNAEATVTFRNLPYGEYNLFTSSKASGLSSTISLVVEDNQGDNVSDILRSPATVIVSLSEQQRNSGKLLFLQGSHFSVILDGSKSLITLDSLPAQFTTVASLCDAVSILATSPLFTLTENSHDTLIVK